MQLTASEVLHTFHRDEISLFLGAALLARVLRHAVWRPALDANRPHGPHDTALGVLLPPQSSRQFPGRHPWLFLLSGNRVPGPPERLRCVYFRTSALTAADWHSIRSAA